MEKIEFEATFLDIDKDDIRGRLKKIGAELVKDETFMKRYTFDLPEGHRKQGAWVRVRDEGDKITMTYKRIADAGKDKIDNQKEIELDINDFEAGVVFLETIGCYKQAYQETKREIWKYLGCEIMIDEWPHLEPLVEVEGDSERSVKQVSEMLGFDWGEAKFVSADYFYADKYGVERLVVCNIPRLCFDDENPFLKKED